MAHGIRIDLPDVDLRATLVGCAQCFGWQEAEDGFRIALDDGSGPAAYCVREAEGGVIVEGDRLPDPAFWRAYFDADRDYGRLAEEYAWHEKTAAALRAAQGLRILRQNAWDTVVAFILSANNNVGRITTLVNRLSRAYGTPAAWKGETLYAMPAPEQLCRATEAELRALGCGYRAPYLVDTAARVAGGFDLDALRNVPYAEAHAALVTLKGVGDKVADCICLFGLGHTCAFPVDVWVERLLKAWFGMEGLSRKRMAQRALELFGEDAGLVQQYLFHCARMGLLEL